MAPFLRRCTMKRGFAVGKVAPPNSFAYTCKRDKVLPPNPENLAGPILKGTEVLRYVQKKNKLTEL